MTRNIEALLQDMKNYIPFYAKQKPDISDAGIGWHIAHSLLTIDRIISRLSQTNPAGYKRKFSFPKLLVFTTGTIPKGRAQSPETVRPKGDIDTATLQQQLGVTKDNLKKLESINPGQFFEHPYFGHLKLKEAVKFLAIHTKHHLKIIQRINA